MSTDLPSTEDASDLQLEDFESRIVLRQLRIEDFDALVEMGRACFPGMPPWTREHIESQLAHFPEGQFAIELEGRLVASASSLIVDFDAVQEWHDWRRVADAGYIRNHSPEGDTLYGIEIMVHPDCRGMRLARRLYEARKELVRQMDLARIIVGGRIPGYGALADQLTALEYVDRVVQRGQYDPVLTTQVANGFVVRELIPDYFPEDEASRGYATHLEWVNLEHVRDPSRRWAHVAPARIASVQYLMRHLESWEEFCQQCEYFIAAAADANSDFVLFPELITTQLLALEGPGRPSDQVRNLARRTPEYLDFFNTMSIKHNVNIIGGTQFTLGEEGALTNVAYLFRRDGTIEAQPKIHVTPAERRWWGIEGGDQVQVFDTDRGRISILVCYDIEFPELARIATAKGAKILFVPFNTENRTGYLRIRYCSQARAIENGVYVAISGCAGNLPFVAAADTHYAQSGNFTPLDFAFARDGIGAECTPNIETLVVHDVDLESLRRHRATGTVRPWSDRRRDLYGVSYTDEHGVRKRV
jgi:predicted amidohydrolase/ribosomal protein S18 acetylase RimI-like enzyme